MEKITVSIKDKILITVVIVLCALFAGALFKNIAYPLLWNDEAETAMYATRILKYGYPKVFDGKNMVYLLELPPQSGVKEGIDAYIGTAWGQYYFGAIGAFLAERVEDIYAKTAILRSTFTLAGFAGIVIMALAFARVFTKSLTAKLSFFTPFIFFELISVSLILNLRQVRYCPLLIFLSACIFYLYTNHRILRRVNAAIYVSGMALLLILTYVTFPPLYIALVLSMGLFECFGLLIELFQRKGVKNGIVNISPLFISFVAVIPILKFFETLRISQEFNRMFSISLKVQIAHLLETFQFFRKYEFLYVVLAVKAILIILFVYVFMLEILVRFTKGKRKAAKGGGLPGQDKAVDYQKRTETWQKLWISNLLTLLFIIYIFIISKMPLPFIYSRYFIVVQPILISVLLLDIFIVLELIFLKDSSIFRRAIALCFIFLICMLCISNSTNKVKHIENYIYELSHRYRGPLDFVIPYIKSNFENPERLVIATNYAELTYMYYLRSKVIIGYVGHNIKEELKMRPDIIIVRKRPAYTNRWRMLDTFLQRDRYKKFSFRVFDYPVNNIPEIDGHLLHLFKTKMARSKRERLDIYVKQ